MYLDTSGSSVEYFQYGDGEPIILIHCTGSSSAQWGKLVSYLADKHRVITLNLYGYGKTSSWDGRTCFSIKHEAELVKAIIQIVGEPVHLVGHSYGGSVALEVARTWQTCVRSLSVFEPASFNLLQTGRPADRIALQEISAVARAVWDSLANGDYITGCQTFLDYWSGEGSWKKASQSKRDSLIGNLPKIALDFKATLGEPWSGEGLDGLAIRKLVVGGSGSPLSANQVRHRLLQFWPDASHELIVGAGHMGPITHGDYFNQLIGNFLEA